MKSTLLSAGLAGSVLLCCVALSVPARADSLQIRNVGPAPQTPLVLSPGKRTRIVLTVDYTLNSADNASLNVFAEEYPDVAAGCRGDAHSTDGGSQYAIQRGGGTASITIIWPANAAGDPVPVYPKGYMTLGANFSTPDGSKIIRDFGLFSDICYRFAPRSVPAPPTGRSIPPFYRWQPASNGSVPLGAIVGGYSSVQPQPGSTAVSYGTPYYVCRVAYNGNLFPGKVVAKNCNFSAATGKELLASSYEVLTAQSAEYSLNWQQSGTPPANALVGGRSGQDLYLCQLPFQGGLHPGWALPAPNGQYVCYIGWGGKEVVLPGFSYLVPIKGQRID